MYQRYLCEDSMEGIFTGIYKAYENNVNHNECSMQIGEEMNLVLFTEYTKIIPDENITKKVADVILKQMGLEAYTDICRAIASPNKEKGDAVYHVVVKGLSQKMTKGIMGDLTDPFVRKVFELSRCTNNEIMHLEGFLHFQELENGILFAKIGPKNNILTFLAPHFANRFPMEHFVIYDDKRQLFVIHPRECAWVLVSGETLHLDITEKMSDSEKQYQELFRHFCHTIAIKERRNLNLQRQMLPLRFQEYMVEFQ